MRFFIAPLLSGLLIFSVQAEDVNLQNCDIARGEMLFVNCSICHTNDDSNQHSAGPNLGGLINREIAAFQDYPYSAGMAKFPGIWSLQFLDEFLENPMITVPGTMMAFAGLRKEKDRSDLICYLQGS